MRAIGFRAEPKLISFAVIEGTKDAPRLVTHGKLTAPATYDEMRSLTWYRTRVLAELGKHKPDRAGVRYPEVFGRKGGTTTSDQQRLRIEGVILEALASAGMITFGGIMRQISSLIGSDSAKAYKEDDEFRGLDWSQVNDKFKEAILVAVAALEVSA